MTAPYSPLAIANTMIEASGPDGIDHLSLQKLVYLAAGWWLGCRDTRLVGEMPEIWPRGPVYASLFSVLKHFRMAPVLRPQSPNFLVTAPGIAMDDAEAQAMISWIMARYAPLGPAALSAIAHAPFSPWAEMARELGYRASPGTTIPEDRMRRHFRREAVLVGARDAA